MPRKKKDESELQMTQDELLKLKAQLDERESMLDVRDQIMEKMPEGELTTADIRKFFASTRKERLAVMFALATKSPSERTRKEMILRLDDMDIGKPGAKKLTDADEVDGVIIQSGSYGV